MFSLFRKGPTRKLGQVIDPSLNYIRRIYAEQIKDIKSYYRRSPKHVESNNIFAQIIQHVNIEFKTDDATYAKLVDDRVSAITRAFGIVSSINKGKVFEGGITLGPATSEILVSTSDIFDTKDLKSRWFNLTPVYYLYHTRTDTNLPIMNNTTPGKGYGVTVVNIPMLMVMFRYWYKWNQLNRPNEIPDVQRFIGSFVLPNMIDSYLDISFFNRLSRQAFGIKNFNFNIQHPIYITDMNPRIDKFTESINREAVAKGVELEALAYITPMIVKPNLYEVMKLPNDPITRNNEQAYTLAWLPYLKYLITMMQRGGGFDKSTSHDVLIELIEIMNDQRFNYGDGVIGNQIENVKNMLKLIKL